MKIEDALVCIDCDRIFSRQSLPRPYNEDQRCPFCGSEITAALGNWLGGPLGRIQPAGEVRG